MDKKKKLSAYADDTTILVTNPNEIPAIMNTLNTYCKASGAKINQDKTEAINLGTWKEINIKEILAWKKKKRKILGIIYTHQNMEQQNIGPIITKIKEKKNEKTGHQGDRHSKEKLISSTFTSSQ